MFDPPDEPRRALPRAVSLRGTRHLTQTFLGVEIPVWAPFPEPGAVPPVPRRALTTGPRDRGEFVWVG